MHVKGKAKVMRMEEAFWEVPPGHSSQALSKMLVHPTNADTLRRRGVVELDGERHLLEPNMFVHIPPGVRHGIFNTGVEDLVFIVVASPPSDMPEVKQTGGREP